jgi:asparagine synthase (glutamine-hydrolysing)
MAGLFLVQTREPEFAAAALAGAREQFALHGFSGVTETELPGWRLLHAPPIIGGPDCLLVQGDDLVAVAGTLTCDGKIGRPALEALLEMVAAGDLDWSRIGGHFVALVRAVGQLLLFTDYFASFQLFHDADLRLFSTSLLGAARALPRLTLDRQSVYEFAFNVVPLGNDTVISELKRLGPFEVADLRHDGAMLRPVAKPLPDAPVEMPIVERIAVHRERLGGIVRDHLQLFGDRVFCPLSGGLDSRLLLSILRAEGCRPSVYVYGANDGADVRVAKAIGRAEGFEVEWFDKDGYALVAPDAFPALVESTFQDHDGLPNFGGLFDNGGNAAARDARHAGGALAASGGCGEVFRNFFFLPDRPTTAGTVARAFFARYSKAEATSLFDERQFLRAIEDKILADLGLPGERGKLPRTVIEQIYPRSRCRSLFGKEISDEARHGAYMMPFLDHQVVAAGLTVPMHLKNAGRFEAMLVNAIDPALARQPSAYGHDFAGQPGLGHRLSEWSTRVRPAWVRHRSYAVQRRLGTAGDEHGGLLGPEYLGRVIDLDFPVMRRFFHPERVNDNGVYRRIACLEYFANRLGSRLAL